MLADAPHLGAVVDLRVRRVGLGGDDAAAAFLEDAREDAGQLGRIRIGSVVHHGGRVRLQLAARERSERAALQRVGERNPEHVALAVGRLGMRGARGDQRHAGLLGEIGHRKRFAAPVRPDDRGDVLLIDETMRRGDRGFGRGGTDFDGELDVTPGAAQDQAAIAVDLVRREPRGLHHLGAEVRADRFGLIRDQADDDGRFRLRAARTSGQQTDAEARRGNAAARTTRTQRPRGSPPGAFRERAESRPATWVCSRMTGTLTDRQERVNAGAGQ